MKVSQCLVTSVFDTGRYFIFPLFLQCTAEGDLTNILKCVAEDDGFHVNASLVVAPDFFIRNQIDLLKELVSHCDGHILCLGTEVRYLSLL